jgi:hypothetical protein
VDIEPPLALVGAGDHEHEHEHEHGHDPDPDQDQEQWDIRDYTEHTGVHWNWNQLVLFCMACWRWKVLFRWVTFGE